MTFQYYMLTIFMFCTALIIFLVKVITENKNHNFSIDSAYDYTIHYSVQYLMIFMVRSCNSYCILLVKQLLLNTNRLKEEKS